MQAEIYDEIAPHPAPLVNDHAQVKHLQYAAPSKKCVLKIKPCDLARWQSWFYSISLALIPIKIDRSKIC